MRNGRCGLPIEGLRMSKVFPQRMLHTWQRVVTRLLRSDAIVLHKEAGGSMNNTTQGSEVGMMRFTLREDGDTDFLGRAAEQILQLPSVLRVRTNPARQEIEIVFKRPAEGLLRQVNNALQTVGTEMAASKVR